MIPSAVGSAKRDITEREERKSVKIPGLVHVLPPKQVA